MLEGTPNLDFWQDSVVGILTEQGRCVGVTTGLGMEIRAKSVVLTNGTFLNGLLHIGEKQFGVAEQVNARPRASPSSWSILGSKVVG